MNAAKRLRKLLTEPSIIMAPGCHDALGALFIQRAGFKAAYMSGYGVACSLLGRPDLGELTMTEMVAHAHRIASAVDIPLISDADTGYGGPSTCSVRSGNFSTPALRQSISRTKSNPNAALPWAVFRSRTSKRPLPKFVPRSPPKKIPIL